MAGRKNLKKTRKLPRRSDAQRGAKLARAKGRGGDVHLIHVNDGELAQMHDAWGAPSINPETGLPEYGFFSKLGKTLKFAVHNIGNIGKQVLHNPKRLVFGIDPLGTKIGNKVTGSNDKPLVEQLGGPTQQSMQDYESRNGAGSLGYTRPLKSIADTVASFYAGGALGGQLSGAAQGFTGSQVAGQIASRAGQAALSRGVAAANTPGFAGEDNTLSGSGGASASTGGLSSTGTPSMPAKIPKGATYSSRDAWFTDTARAALDRASTLADRPYTPYEGERVAGLSANEQQAGSMAAGMDKRYQPMADRLQGGFSTEALAPYMNPYTDSVLNSRLRGINDEFGHQSGDLNRDAAATDAFRSGRTDLARARLESSKMRALDDATNETKSAAFESGKDSYFRQGSQDISGIGALSGADSNQISALNQTGGADRSVRQAQNDFNYGQHLERRDWSMNNLNNLLAAIGAVNPAAGSMTVGPKAKNGSDAMNWGAVIGTVSSAIGEYYGGGSGGSGGYSGGGFDAGSDSSNVSGGFGPVLDA